MFDTATQAPAKPGRKQRRKRCNAPTVVRRLTVEEGSFLRVTVTDTSDVGLGLISITPLRVGDHCAINLTLSSTQSEILLSRVQHCCKNSNGQYRLGVSVLDRQPGDLVRSRVPSHWLAKA